MIRPNSLGATGPPRTEAALTTSRLQGNEGFAGTETCRGMPVSWDM